ncbi:MAG: hypothetical protein Q8T08_21905 [Ignavibacteria bacterium]|nr:hypothetical protein [Ignavibacteria bacterium]
MEIVELTSFKKLILSSRNYDKDIEAMLLAFSDYINTHEFCMTRSDECRREMENILPSDTLFNNLKQTFLANINYGLSKNDSLKMSLAEILNDRCVSVSMNYANAIANQVFFHYEIRLQEAMSDASNWTYLKKTLMILAYIIGGIISVLMLLFWANNTIPIVFDKRIELLCCLWLISYLILLSISFNKKILGKMLFGSLVTQLIILISVYMMLFPIPFN